MRAHTVCMHEGTGKHTCRSTITCSSKWFSHLSLATALKLSRLFEELNLLGAVLHCNCWMDTCLKTKQSSSSAFFWRLQNIQFFPGPKYFTKQRPNLCFSNFISVDEATTEMRGSLWDKAIWAHLGLWTEIAWSRAALWMCPAAYSQCRTKTQPWVLPQSAPWSKPASAPFMWLPCHEVGSCRDPNWVLHKISSNCSERFAQEEGVWSSISKGHQIFNHWVCIAFWLPAASTTYKLHRLHQAHRACKDQLTFLNTWFWLLLFTGALQCDYVNCKFTSKFDHTKVPFIKCNLHRFCKKLIGKTIIT